MILVSGRLIYPFLAFVLTGPIVYIRDEIPHSDIIVIRANVMIFLGTWFLIHKWMIKAAKKSKVYGKVLSTTREVINIFPVSPCLP